MIDLKRLELFYPENLRPFKRNLLREYLQCKILEIIFDSEFANSLCFMGGTAIRIVHSNNRFSEDLDFDNLHLDKRKFEKLTKQIGKKLSLEGYEPEIKSVFKGALHSYFKFPGLLFENRLSGHPKEKLTVQMEAEPQNFDYRPDKITLNRFDVFLQINVVPPDILLAQKIVAVFKRKRPMGRDFYDAVFLLGRTKPNFGYLNVKLGIKNEAELKKRLLAFCRNLNFKALAKDVEPFLFSAGDSKKVLLFPEYIKNYKEL